MQRECEKNMLIKVIEPIVYLIIIVNLVIAISYKRKSKKTPVKVVVPIVILGIGLFVCDTIYTHRSFSSVEKAMVIMLRLSVFSREKILHMLSWIMKEQ